MGVRFAARVTEMRSSAVREMLKLTAKGDIVSFAGGLPPAECFPLEAVAAVSGRLLADEGARALQYSTTEGCPELRSWLAEHMRARLEVGTSADEILVTTGSQQALDLTAKVFLDEGDVVYCESPTYLAALGAFRPFRPRFVPVPSDENGMIGAELARLVRDHGPKGIVYVIPDFQNPSGRTWSLERRCELLALAERFDLRVIEDAPYRELRFEGEDLPALVSLDRGGRVVFLSTVSKILSPGLRVGWVAAPREVLEKYVLAKQAADLHTSTLAQLIVARLVREHDLTAHVAAIRRVCRERRDALLGAIGALLPTELRVSRPQGGLFLWLDLPPGLAARPWLERSLERGAAFVPGDAFYPSGGGEHAARLCFSGTPPDRIVEGVRRLATALRELDGAEALAWPKRVAA